ncbi:MAG TPA: RecX family transcriptional regulator [Fodinibius sp.]|nr:RecX family transcriptional regulator [Fodinibius sp.]
MDEEAEHNLPGLISSIAVQKRNKKRYSIFVDEQFLMGVSEDTLITFDLSMGKNITPALFRKLQREEGRFAIKKYLLKLLARRAHARKELMNKAIRKDYPREIIDSLLDELERKGYINDVDFARSFARDKYKMNRWGPVKIKAHLLKKGVGHTEAERSIQAAFKDEDLEETFIHLISKRKRRYQREENLLKRKKKVISYLAQKGYYASDIYDSIDRLMMLIEK